jgi:hypothetical protein
VDGGKSCERAHEGEIDLQRRVDCDTVPIAMVVVDSYSVLGYEGIKSEVVEEDSIVEVTCRSLESAKSSPLSHRRRIKIHFYGTGAKYKIQIRDFGIKHTGGQDGNLVQVKV